jgi:hypothetical protein
MIFSHTRKHRLRVIAGMTLVVLASTGCGLSEPPMAIRMYHPGTKQTLHCTARDQAGQNSKLLANAVEACARQLEASGFVREK